MYFLWKNSQTDWAGRSNSGLPSLWCAKMVAIKLIMVEPRPKYIIQKDRKNCYFWSLRNSNDYDLIVSDTFVTKHACLNSVHQSKSCTNISNFRIKPIGYNKYGCYQVGQQNLLIGKNEKFRSLTQCNCAILTIKRDAPLAGIEDRSVFMESIWYFFLFQNQINGTLLLPRQFWV